MLQSAARKEFTRIAIGTLIMTAVMIVVFFILSLFTTMAFGIPVIVSALGGCLVACLNFLGLCLGVQKSTATDDPKNAKAAMQVSYQQRMLLQAVWCIVSIAVSWFNPFAAIIPLLFPRIVIMIVQFTGHKAAAHSDNSQEMPTEKDEAQ